MAAVRATASNVTISFGLISFPVDLVPAIRSKSNKTAGVRTTSLCPTCTEPNPVSQVYQCDKGHGPFARGDLPTGLVVDGAVHRPTEEQLATLDVAGARGTVALTVYPAEQVEATTMPSGNVYRLRPRDNHQHYALVRALVEDGTVAFLTEHTNRGATKLYRLQSRDGLLTLVELVRPSEFHEPEAAPTVEFDPKLLGTGRTLVDALVEDFDPATFADKRKERLVALANSTKPTEVREDRPVVDAVADLAELIRRSTKAA